MYLLYMYIYEPDVLLDRIGIECKLHIFLNSHFHSLKLKYRDKARKSSYIRFSSYFAAVIANFIYIYMHMYINILAYMHVEKS